MSFLPEDKGPNLYQLWDEHQKLLGIFKTKEQAHKHAEKTKLQKYTVIGIYWDLYDKLIYQK